MSLWTWRKDEIDAVVATELKAPAALFTNSQKFCPEEGQKLLAYLENKCTETRKRVGGFSKPSCSPTARPERLRVLTPGDGVAWIHSTSFRFVDSCILLPIIGFPTASAALRFFFGEGAAAFKPPQTEVQLRCGTPPLQAAHRISSPIQLGRSV